MQSITFLDPATGGVLNIANSVDEKAKKWFECDIPEQPQKTVTIKVNRIWKYIESTKEVNTCRYV